ncbi:hypothetical protein [Bifidobacterium apousia]|nr:hypothetical protein [Bifidobacterium apousia]
MGFWIMVFAALLGLALIVRGFVLSKKDKRWFALCILGVASLTFAVWLAI